MPISTAHKRTTGCGDLLHPSILYDTRTAELLQLAGSSDAKVLIIGETGTGKSTLARIIHDKSGVPGNFVHVDCTSIPDALMESELFGAGVGAYTGAVKARVGRIELASEGTLFLDEVDSMPLTMQAKLLHAIQEKGVTRLGENTFRPSYFRLIAATHKPLDMLVNAGLFRMDLYYRLAVLEIHLPALREFSARIPGLFDTLVEMECKHMDRACQLDTTDVHPQLMLHDWPGNYRELIASAQRFVLGLAPLKQPLQIAAGAALRDKLATVEQHLLCQALKNSNGLLRPASHALGLPLETLRYRLRLYGISTPERASGE